VVSAQRSPGARLSAAALAAERRRLAAALVAAGRPDKHFDLQHYVGSPVPALGVYTKDLRAVARSFRHRFPGVDLRDLHALADRLWHGRVFEERLLACELLVAERRRWTDESWDVATAWIDTAEGWGLCDTLGNELLGRMVDVAPSRLTEVRGWVRSPNPWRRRVAVYALGRRIRAGDLDAPFAFLTALRRDPDPWVQRAVGTWLRECWKVDPGRTEAFLLRYARELPAVVRSVATERAPQRFRDRLRVAAGR
jgi:3-methyladenine DNA glycosylase AlkD